MATVPFMYRFNAPYKSVMCVYKLWFKNKYFIWKCKALHQSVTMASEEIGRRFMLGVKEDDLWANVIKHIGHRSVNVMNIELVHEAVSPADLLITEYKMLKDAKDDPLCLNKFFTPGIPKWIPLTEVDVYNKFVEDDTKPKVKVKKTAKKPARKTKVSAARNAKVSTPRRSSRKKS